MFRRAMATMQIMPRDLAVQPQTAILSLRTPVNWTAVLFFSALSLVHASIAIPAFYHGRWEGFLSAIFSVLFAGVSVIAYFAHARLTMDPDHRYVHLRWGVPPLRFERIIPFSDIREIRLTLAGTRKHPESRIELLCESGDVECPQTPYPRQHALLMAMTIGAPLTKVIGTEQAAETPRRI
jgi:hypothetical protein